MELMFLVREESSKKKKGKMIAYENPLVLKFGKLFKGASNN